MSKNRHKKNQFSSYNPVETQSNTEEKPFPFSNPFKVVGSAKPSKTGRSLTMKIRHPDGEIHDYTILKLELERVFMYIPKENDELIPCEIREYFNEQD